MVTGFRLHHIGLIAREISGRATDLVQRFGYTVESEIIEDPKQQAFVQFLRLPGAGHWLELISPNGPDSGLWKALQRGSTGPHHLCYEVESVAAACQALRERKMALVSPPVPAVAFGGRPIAWLMDGERFLVELVEAGPGPLSLLELQTRTNLESERTVSGS